MSRFNIERGDDFMGYFSQLDASMNSCDNDLSYPSSENQLLMRLDDLKLSLRELSHQSHAFNNPYILTDDDLRYVLPEHLYSVRNVKKAIELAEFDLRNDYGIVPETAEGESLCVVFVPDELYSFASVA